MGTRHARLKDYELLYDLPVGEVGDVGANCVRTVTIRAGQALEVMCHPLINLNPEAKREARRRKTTPAMARLNARNTERYMTRLIEENFTQKALVFTGTYAYPVQENGLYNLEELRAEYERRGVPWSVEEVRRDVRNFLSKVRRRVIRAAGNADSFRWLQRIEEGKEPAVYGLPCKYHCHLVLEGEGLNRDELEELWGHGFTQCQRLDLKNDGAARLARYLCKQRKGGRWWSHSRNMRIPQPRTSDRKVSRRRLAKIAADVQHDGRSILEALYPGYKVVELPDVKYSDFVPGCYIYARLRRVDTTPPWQRSARRDDGRRGT